MHKLVFLILLIALLFIINPFVQKTPSATQMQLKKTAEKPKSILPLPPPRKTLKNDYFVVQSFNNCGPASLSMALSYFDIHESQEKLGESLRPYQNTEGNNDDKSVTLDELAQKAQEYNLLAYHRPNGNTDLIKQFIHNNIPVITKTWLSVDEDIGHYRVIKGYDDEKKIIIQDDSYQGQNIFFSYDDFDSIWKKFDYEYLVIIPKNKKALAESIIGKNLDEKTAWKEALKRNEKELDKNPSDVTSTFNISVASYYLGDYKRSVAEFEKIETQLPSRTLWYQIEPIKAYYELKNYDRVFALSDAILNNNNQAFSELYILRGKIYQARGDMDAARNEFENAVLYNKNLKDARLARNYLQKTQ